MKPIGRFDVVLAFVLAATLLLFCAWLSPGERSRLSKADVDHYIGRLQGKLPAAPDEERVFLERLRDWGYHDDGRPVHMLNVMRYYEHLRSVPGSEGIALSPRAANERYETAVMPLLLRRGGFPVYAGNALGTAGADGRHADLVGADRSPDAIDRILVVRYPSRRAFFELLSDPDYLKLTPYKAAALELALVPLQAESVPPDLRWVLGGVLLMTWIALVLLRRRRNEQSGSAGGPSPT